MIKENVCAYCRVSTNSNDQENSFENQKSYFEREINKNESYQLYKIYADKGISGTNLSRPEFDTMLTDAGLDINNGYAIVKEPKFNLILVKNTSRFARNVSVDVILKALVRNNVYVYFLDLNKSTKNPEDITYIQIFSVFDERESRDKSKKVRFGLEESARKGNIQYTHIYGYKYLKKPENRLEIIDDEAEIVRMMYDLYVNKLYGIRKIQIELVKLGIKTRQGKDFGDSIIRNILKNETYTGRGVRFKYTYGEIFSEHGLKKTGNPLIFETDKVPQIIDTELFNKAQEIMNGRKQKNGLLGKKHFTTPYGGGKIVCGSCGAYYRSTTATSGGNKLRYYVCNTKKQINFDENGERYLSCCNPNVSEKKLDEIINSEVYTKGMEKRLKFGIKYLEDIKKLLQERIDKPSLEQVEELKKLLGDYERKKEKLIDLYTIEEQLTKEQFTERVNPINEEILKTNQQIKELSKTNEQLEQDILEVQKAINEITEQYNSLFADNYKLKFINQPREILIKDLENFKIMPDGSIRIHFKSIENVVRYYNQYHHFIPQSNKNKLINVSRDIENDFYISA